LKGKSSKSIGAALSQPAGTGTGGAFTGGFGLGAFGFGEPSGAALLGAVAGGFASCPQMHPISEIHMLLDVGIHTCVSLRDRELLEDKR